MENFVLEFGNKNVVIRFNDSKKMFVVGENAPWESIPYMNALGHLMNTKQPFYAVMEEGMYLHKTLPALIDSLPTDNAGYATHPVIKQMIEAGMLRRDLELKPGIYRLKWNGLFLTAQDLPFRLYVEGEDKQFQHDRDAFQLIMAFETIRKAAAQGSNIRLLYSEKFQARVNHLEKMYGLFVAGDADGVLAMLRGGIDAKATYNTLQDYARRSNNAVVKGKGFELPKTVAVVGNDEMPTEQLIGLTIQFVKGGTTLSTEWTVTDGLSDINKSILNVGDMVASAKERGLKIFVASKVEAAADASPAPEAPAKIAKAPRKARQPRVNVPVQITE